MKEKRESRSTPSPDPRREKALQMLRQAGVNPNKLRGQNFLLDDSAVAAIANFIAPRSSEKLIEIGPGLGVLTEQLADRGLLAVIEIEPAFCQALRNRFTKIEVIEADIRALDLDRFDPPITVVGNLPYSISTEIIFHLLKFTPQVERAVFLLQSEFVQRMAAAPGSRDYGALSVGVQLRANLRLGPTISGDSFYPTTKVLSQLVELRPLAQPRFGIIDTERFCSWIANCFASRRQTLVNSLTGASKITTQQLTSALEQLNLNPEARPEQISLAQFVELYRALGNSD